MTARAVIILPLLLALTVASAGRLLPPSFLPLGPCFFVPGAILGLAGGDLFGPLWGTLLNLTGTTLGSRA
jgi:uncharacterized membrane protein YdjX (TVP38/TMEM64 family)